MKKVLYLFFCILALTSCKKSGSSNEEESFAQPGIYVRFEAESPIISYTDNNPKIPDNVNTGISYGPCQAGTYLFTAKLQNNQNYPQQAYTLSSPASGFTARTYTIRFYYSSGVNRWLYSYATYTDSK